MECFHLVLMVSDFGSSIPTKMPKTNKELELVYHRLITRHSIFMEDDIDEEYREYIEQHHHLREMNSCN